MFLFLFFIDNWLYFKEFLDKIIHHINTSTDSHSKASSNFQATLLMNRLKNRSFRISPLGARWNSSHAKDPRVANAIARCHLWRFRCQTQHAHLAHVAIAVAHPNVSRALSIGQGGRSTGELQASSSLSNRQRSHKFWAGPPIGGQRCKSRYIDTGQSKKEYLYKRIFYLNKNVFASLSVSHLNLTIYFRRNNKNEE